MRKKELPMVFAYVSEEEKQALEMLARLESRSSSSLIKFELNRILKRRGLLKEELSKSGLVIQTVTPESYVEEGVFAVEP